MRKTSRGLFERPSRSGIWWIDYHDAQGRRHREKVGRRRAAIEAYELRKQQVREGKFFGVRGNAGPTFEEIAKERLETGRTLLRPESNRTDAQRIKPLLEVFGKRLAASITPREIDRFLASLVEKGRSPATANRYRSLVGKIFKYAARDKRIPESPMPGVPRRRESPGRVRYLATNEEVALRRQIQAECPERMPEFELALHTGMRRGEQYGLKRDGVDLKNAILTVSGKTGERRVHMNSSAVAAVETLLARRSEGPTVASREGGPWFERSVRRAGIQHFRWHDLRHTFASRLVMAGTDIRSVQELLGHKSIVMTMKYSHLSPDYQKANVEKLVALNAIVTTEAEPQPDTNGTVTATL